MSDTFTFSSWGSSWPGSPGNMFDVFFSRWAGITNVGSCPAQGTVPDPLGLTANPLFQVKTGSKETSSPHWAEPLQSPFQKDPAPWIYLCFAISRDTHRSSLSQCLPQEQKRTSCSHPLQGQGHPPPAQDAQGSIHPALSSPRDDASTVSLSHLFMGFVALRAVASPQVSFKRKQREKPTAGGASHVSFLLRKWERKGKWVRFRFAVWWCTASCLSQCPQLLSQTCSFHLGEFGNSAPSASCWWRDSVSQARQAGLC